jgi:hypothetical protein
MTATLLNDIRYGMPAEEYHANPALSSSGARKLLPPSCPAIYHYERQHPPARKRTFELGHAAHKTVLGIGPDLVLVDEERWDTKETKARVAEIRNEGGVPLKKHEYDQVQAMATALRRHEWASALLDPSTGQPEVSLFWQDQRTGLDRRARFDWLRTEASGRFLGVDYKTAESASLDDIRKAIHNYGYNLAADWYLDGARTLGLAGPDAAFLLIVQEKTPPFVVTVVQIDSTALAIGRVENRRAIDIYMRCTETGIWPGYTDDVALVGVPAYIENRYDEWELHR